MKLADFDKAIVIWGVLSQEGLKEIKLENTVVIVPENRPYLFGLLHNIPLLKENQLKFFYCTDNMLGFLFYKGKIKKTIIFYKKITSDGILGVCGSLYIALLSKIHGVAIKIYLQGKLKNIYLDKDSSTLGGRKIIFSNKNRNFIELPRDENIERSMLK